MQCCGDPFEVGSFIDWRTGSCDSDWFELILGPAEAARITDAVDHHANVDALLTRMTGIVRAINAATCRYERLDGARVLTSVERSGALRPVTAADGWEREDNEMTFLGYSVDIDTEPAGRP